MDTFSIYLRLMTASVMAKMEYKFSFFFMLFALSWYYIGQIGVILVVLNKFNTINGWTLGEMAFLYGLMVFSQALTTFIFSSLNHFEGQIIEGTFDRLLLRPLSPLGQILAGNFDLSSIAHLLIGSVALYYGSTMANIDWTFDKILFFMLVITGAALIQGGIRIAVSAVTFWTLRNRSLVHILIFSSKEFILYPVSIFNQWVQIFLTVVFPIAFINFYPSHYFLDKETGDLLFHPAIQYMTPVVGIIVFALSFLLWRTGINRYQSVGN